MDVKLFDEIEFLNELLDMLLYNTGSHIDDAREAICNRLDKLRGNDDGNPS